MAFMFSIDMNALRAIESIGAVSFPRQGIHINRKRDASPNPIVRQSRIILLFSLTARQDGFSQGRHFPAQLLFILYIYI
jgi:hypothetical protein